MTTTIKCVSMTVPTTGNQFVVYSERGCKWISVMLLFSKVPSPLFLVLDMQLHNASAYSWKFVELRQHATTGPGCDMK